MTDVLVDGLTFPEAPRWRDGKLWLSDFYSHRVLTVDLAGHLETVAEVPQRPSGLGWRPDGTEASERVDGEMRSTVRYRVEL